MKVINTEIEGLKIIEPTVFEDERGFFLETFHAERYKKEGINGTFVQDNYSRSGKGILRGLHFQKNKPQGKLIRVVRGEIFDVAVDLRRSSKTFGQWLSVNLSEQNKRQLWIPPGFAHGFCSLSDITDIEYKCTDFYDPNDEVTLQWDDVDIGILWPITNPILSKKDQSGISFKEFTR